MQGGAVAGRRGGWLAVQGRGAPDTPCRNPCASRTAGGRTTRRRSKAPACAAPALQRVAAGRRCAPAPARLTPAAGRTRRAWRGRALMRRATPPKALRRRRSTASPAPRQAPRQREEREPLVLRAGVDATDNRHSGYAVRTAGVRRAGDGGEGARTFGVRWDAACVRRPAGRLDACRGRADCRSMYARRGPASGRRLVRPRLWPAGARGGAAPGPSGLSRISGLSALSWPRWDL